MSRREFLMLAQTYKQGKHSVANWYMSEKLDGLRCFWDGGITTGKPCADVPWCNTEKHARFVNEQIATGLWTRYMQPLHAPRWFLDALPVMPLDGELYLGRKSWQQLTSIVKSQSGTDWSEVQFRVFDSPPLAQVLRDGVVNNNNVKKTLKGCLEWAKERLPKAFTQVYDRQEFFRVRRLMLAGDFKFPVVWHEQVELPMSFSGAEALVANEVERIDAQGGEGLILRHPSSIWEPKRLHTLLKVKTYEDMEGTVVGYKFAKPTDLERSISGVATNKLLGLMGSLRLRLDNGKEFDLSGFTDAERVMSGKSTAHPDDTARTFGLLNPGAEAPDWAHNVQFPRGSRVTFRFRELSDDGYPKEARYWRKA